MNVLVVVSIVAVLIGISQSATIVVNSQEDYTIGSSRALCSLRGAIINANTNRQTDPNCPAGTSGLDLIILNTDYTLTRTGRNEDEGYTGDLDITESLSISSSTQRIINGNSLDRVFHVRGAITVFFTNVTIQNGLDTNLNNSTEFAAGIKASDPTYVNLFNVTFRGNTVDLGSRDAAAFVGAAVLTQGQLNGTNIEFDANVVTGNLPVNSLISACAASFLDSRAVGSKILDFELTNNRVVRPLNGWPTGLTATSGIGLFGTAPYTLSGTGRNNSGKNGGILYVSSRVTQLNLAFTNDIYNNTADVGGVMDYRCEVPVQIEGNFVNIYNNTAASGGVFYTLDDIYLYYFGEVRNNAATNGGVIYAIDASVFLIAGGSLSLNQATTSGGVFYGIRSDFAVENVTNIDDNTAGTSGGVVYLNQHLNGVFGPGVLFNNIYSISDNEVFLQFDGFGGVVAAYNATIVFDGVKIIDNNYAFEGGVVWVKSSRSDTITITNGWNITRNRVDQQHAAGGVVYSEGATSIITNYTGSISNNQSPNGDGALLYVKNANGTISNVVGEITGNFGFDGALISVEGIGMRSTLEYITGDIYKNTGFFNGGLLYCGAGADCYINNIVGDMYENNCGAGCLMYAESGSAFLRDIQGDITGNVAFFTGGAIYSAQTVTVTGIDGIFLSNYAEHGSGGAIASEGNINISGVRSFDSNWASEDGGAIYSANGEVNLDRVCTLNNNTIRDGFGSIIYAYNDINTTYIGAITNQNRSLFYSENGEWTLDDFVSALQGQILVTGYNNSSYQVRGQGNRGSGGYRYFWGNGETTQLAVNIRTPNPYVVIKDSSFCVVNVSTSIPPPIADAGDGLVTCQYSEAVIGGGPTGRSTIVGLQPDYTYVWGPDEAIISDITGANVTVFVAFTTQFNVTVTDTATGLSSTATTYVATPNITLNAGGERTTCNGVPVTLGGTPTANVDYNITLTYNWLPINGLSSNIVPNPITTTSNSITYEVSVSSLECPNYRIRDYTAVNVLSGSPPFVEASPSATTNNFFICKGSSVILGGDTHGTPAPLTFSWTPTAGLDDPTSPYPVASPNQTTVYTLRATTFGGCGSDSDSVTVEVNDLIADSGADVLGVGNIGGIPTAIGGIPPYSYVWSPPTGLNNARSANPVAAPSIATTYTVQVTDGNGCSVLSDIVHVVAKNDLQSGIVSMAFSYITDPTNSTAEEIEASFVSIIASILNIPAIAIKMEVFLPGLLNGQQYYASDFIIYPYGLTGADLAIQLQAYFGCSPAVVPCLVTPSTSTLLQPFGWDAVEFFYAQNNRPSVTGPIFVPGGDLSYYLGSNYAALTESVTTESTENGVSLPPGIIISIDSQPQSSTSAIFVPFISLIAIFFLCLV